MVAVADNPRDQFKIEETRQHRRRPVDFPHRFHVEALSRLGAGANFLVN